MLLVSVFIEYDQWGRMGNRMFQYAFGAILAKHIGTEVYSNGIPNFNIPQQSINRQLINPVSTRTFGNNIAPVEELIQHQGDIIVNSFLQKADYYINEKNFLRQLFSIDNKPAINESTLVLHIRETDYIQINQFPGYDFYRNYINQTGFSDIVIVTDNSTCETVQRLVSEGCKLNTEGCVDAFNHICDNRAMIDFYTLLYSSNVALSQSSFSWWAAFLGEHKNVYFPFCKTIGMWKLTPDIDDVDLYYNSTYNKQIIL